ncbi:hypothetical protein P167DRAFT_265623 [Morchella conica CCBAS932]|uniref:Uncharacterized protein n=1 Tax=Morchella conica CCBAS932 TaxID=1392247 RepID=A0A3N4LFE3_9PEZI|nr:hypothetical protein P167DRAFT_265623 [Morchella conica CCBAS932]
MKPASETMALSLPVTVTEAGVTFHRYIPQRLERCTRVLNKILSRLRYLGRVPQEIFGMKYWEGRMQIAFPNKIPSIN